VFSKSIGQGERFFLYIVVGFVKSYIEWSYSHFGDHHGHQSVVVLISKGLLRDPIDTARQAVYLAPQRVG